MNGVPTMPHLRREVLRVCRSLHSRGFVANHEGNVTVLTARNTILATPTSMSKAEVAEGDLIELDRHGRRVRGSRRSFSEIAMHLAVYRGRPDAGAVVHAHPPASTAFAAAHRAIEARFLPEFVVSMGGVVPLVPFALPGSEALNKALAPFIEEFDTVLLANHGVLAWGPDLTTALLRVEHCEEAANVLMGVKQLGGHVDIPGELLERLYESRTKAGLGPAGRRVVNDRGPAGQ